MAAWLKAALAAVIVFAGIFVIVAAVGFSIIGSIAGLHTNTGSKAFSGPQGPYIAKISIVGEIGGSANQYYSSGSAYHHAWTIETIDTLIGDGSNKGIYLYIDTPGGSVYESDELYLKLMEYKERTERPIYVYMGQIAASGGYYVAASSDYIYANRNTWTGSIGVTLGTLFDVSGFLDEHGIHTDTITSGRNKAMGSYYEPLTGEQKAIYQSLVDDAYGRFVAIVAEGRGLAESKVRGIADGRIYTAAQAEGNGLIDEILGEKEAEDAVKGKFEEGAVLYDCYYSPDTNYLSLFGSLSGAGGLNLWDLLTGGAGEASGGDVYEGDVAAVLELASGQAEAGAPPLKYLYTG